MAARFAVVDAERVARVEPLEPRRGVELALGQGVGTAFELGAGGGLPPVELARPVEAPGLGIGAEFGNFSDTNKRRTRRLLVHEHRDEYVRDQQRGEHRQEKHNRVSRGTAAARAALQSVVFNKGAVHGEEGAGG